MKSSHLIRILPVALVLAAFIVPSQAQTYQEQGDAGEASGTAQATGAGTPLTAITGTITDSTDADLFVISLSDPQTFMATTVNLSTSFDTQLFLFTLDGFAVYTNDDTPGGAAVQSTLPANNANGPFVAGNYILGIAPAGYNPVNFVNSPIFDDYPGGDTTAVRGPRSGEPDTQLDDFTNDFATDSGAYQIDLSNATAAVPEPSSAVLIGIAAAGAGLAAWRRRKRNFGKPLSL